MMRNADKKIAAVLAATRLYMQQEEEAASAMLEAQLASPRPASEPGQWAQSGRIGMMGDRRMMQLRAFSNAR
jgi:hypothetical protein